MSWATRYIERLGKGETVEFRPSGHSMTGIVNHRDLVTVEPVLIDDVKKGDVVLCRVGGRDYLHLVKQRGADGRVLIGNNRGGTNGWTRAVFGRCVKIDQ